MTTLEILKALDSLAQEANSLWNKCESLKLRIAKDSGLGLAVLKKNGISVPEAKQESNAAVHRRGPDSNE